MLPGSALDQPREIDGYEILGPIGHGGMGRVDLARQRNLGRLVAIKWLALPAGADSAELARQLPSRGRGDGPRFTP